MLAAHLGCNVASQTRQQGLKKKKKEKLQLLRAAVTPL